MRPLTSAIAATAAVTAITAANARAFTIEGPWTYDPGTSTFTLPATPSPAELEQFLLQALPTYEGGDALAAGLTGDAILAVNQVTFRVYDDGQGGTFGELGSDINFNPLATGGNVDISTSGDFVDKQLNQQKEQFEVAQQDVENHVFKQEFGQVQSQRRNKAGGDVENIFISFRGPVSIPPGALDVDAGGLTQPFSATVSIPAPPTAALLTPLLPLTIRRRR